MVDKKFILVSLVVMSLFIFACDAQEAIVENNDLGQQLGSGDVEEDVVVNVEDGIVVDVEEDVVDDVEDDVQDDVVDEVVSDDDAVSLDNGITRELIAQRNTASDCWVGFNGLVYDLTDWLSRHPGGADAISPHCGTVEEFTEAYNAQHNRAGTKVELSRNEAIGSLV